jgi:hypothetical protein
MSNDGVFRSPRRTDDGNTAAAPAAAITASAPAAALGQLQRQVGDLEAEKRRRTQEVLATVHKPRASGDDDGEVVVYI